MSDYQSTESEFLDLQNNSKEYIEKLAFLSNVLDSFKDSIASLEENAKQIICDSSEEYEFIIPILKDYLNGIQQCSLKHKEYVTNPFQFIREMYKKETDKNLSLFNQMKSNIIESRQKLLKSKKDYYNYIKSYEKNRNNLKSSDIKSKEDQDELFKAKKEHYSQLYKYEVDKMNEVITQNNKNYADIYGDLEKVETSTNIYLSNILTRFSQNLSSIGNIYIEFSEKIKKSLEKQIKTKIYNSQLDEKTKLRFKNEKFIEYSKDMTDEDEQNEIDNAQEGKKQNKQIIRLLSLPKKKGYSFELIEKIEEAPDEKDLNKYIHFSNIIKQFAGEKGMKPGEVTDIINILNENSNRKDSYSYSYIFLLKILEFCDGKIINFKNKENFKHLTILMNNICIIEDNTKTYNAIIEISQMIKYNHLFLYNTIQNKTDFFRRKSFWRKIFEDNLTDFIMIKAGELLTKKYKKEEIKKAANDKKTNYIINLGLDKKINKYNSFNEKQKKELELNAYKKICLIISKGIVSMCSFLVRESIINDIIKLFNDKFNFSKSTLTYFQNILYINNKNKIIKKDSKNLFIISCILKFLPQNELIKFLCLNKAMSQDIKKIIGKYILSNENLNIDKRMAIWSDILNLKDIMKLDVYNLAKQAMEFRSVDNLLEEKEKTNISVIKVDLIRTPFICESEKHMKKMENILVSLNYVSADIRYCQGMNLIASFLYILLDHDEEKVFYYLYCMVKGQYRKLFLDNFELLKKFYSVFDKLIFLLNPELHYKLEGENISSQIYSTSWLITLFSEVNSSFEKNNISKYAIMIFENFILDGWSAVINSEFSLINYYFDEIMKMSDFGEIVSFMLQLTHKDILKNENFHKIKTIFKKNSEKIDETLIKKLLEIVEYEEKNKLLKDNA